jgi:nucleotide-binding universal stress UspA family protein
MKINKILIVVDDSRSSIKAIQYGFNLAKDLNAKVMLLNVIETALTLGNPDAGIFPDDALISLKSKAEDFLNRVKAKYGNDIDTELMAPAGDIQPIVIETAGKWKASLIVTGTHARTGFSKLLNGSLAESIIHHSKIPVCVIPMGK